MGARLTGGDRQPPNVALPPATGGRGGKTRAGRGGPPSVPPALFQRPTPFRACSGSRGSWSWRVRVPSCV